MEKEFNYEEELKIDPNALDIEWLRQPNLFMKYSEEAAVRKREMDKTKEIIEVVRAQIDTEIRTDPESYGYDKKPPEDAIKSLIVQHKEYTRCSNLFVKAKFEYDIIVAAVRAFDQRKTALENLVRLLGMDYFSGPKEPRDLDESIINDFKKKRARDNIKKGSRRERKNK